MTVYVDDAFIEARVGRIVGRWCHLLPGGPDGIDELHDLAQSIGLKRSWFQPGIPLKGAGASTAWWHAHYDVVESKRRLAIAAGAVAINSIEYMRMVREIRGLPAFEQLHVQAQSEPPL